MLFHEPSKSILLNVPDPFAIRSVVPKSKVLDHPDFNLAVRHTTDAVKVMRNLGLDVPAPILTQYKWPGKYKPFDHQQVMADFLTMHRKAFNLSEMGVGKSAAALWAADYLMQRGLVKRALILTPLSTMDRVWRNDIFDVLMHRVASIVHGTREQRLDALKVPADFYILNHDGVTIAPVADAINKRPDIDLVIVDEVSMFRNHDTQKYKSLVKMLRPDQRLWLLTGTPCPNAPTDAWALAKLVDSARVPKFFGSFKRATMMQITPFKWLPRPDAYNTAYQAMQPAVRFKKADCLDLPAVTTQDWQAPLTKEQRAAFDTMRNAMQAEAAKTTITAVNAADKINKLRQILCIAENTPVLTLRGWVAIQHITRADRVWDGEEWVTHDGLQPKGSARTIAYAGVRMTPDHEVLTTVGWMTAKDAKNGDACDRPNRSRVRLPDCIIPRWFDHRQHQVCDVVVPVHVRETSGARQPELEREAPAQQQALRLPPHADQCHSPYELHSAIPYLDAYASALYGPHVQGLEELRRAGNNSLRSVEYVSGLLDGYERELSQQPDAGSDQQRERLQQEKLSVGDTCATGTQPTYERDHLDTTRQDANLPSGGGVWGEHTKIALQGTCRLGPVEVVYDLVNCGPRNRFVVRGVSGELVIVHNCGAVKDPVTGTYISYPHGPRTDVLLDAIRSASAKVLVIVPFKGIIQSLEKEVSQHYSTAVLNGDVSPKRRDQIIKDFKGSADPHVLLCHPKVMAHGLNLTEADTLVFYAPIYSNDEFQQVVERFNRTGQTRKMTVIRMGASPLEWEIYKMVDTKTMGQDAILKLYKSVTA